MREMKDSRIEWIENVPSDWTLVPLKWIVKFGKGLPITKNNLIEQGVPVVSYGQIHSKTNSGTHLGKDLIRFVSEKYFQSNPSSLGKKGDIFFADTSEDYAGVGNAVLVDGDDPVFAGYHTVIVRPIDLLYSKYLAYLFLTDAWRSQLCSRVSGIKVFSVTQGLLKETTVILPPAEKIATMTDYLDRKCSQIDAIIARQQEVIEKLKAYKLSVISEAVTKGLDPNVPMKDSGVEWIGKIPEHWEFRKIKNCCDVVDCKNRTPEIIPDGDYIVVRTTCIKDGMFSYNGSYRTDRKNFEEWTAKGQPQYGDIFFTREAPMGEACLVPNEDNLCMGQRVMFFRPIHGEDPRFILYSIYGPLVREYIESKNKGSTVGHLKLGQVASLPLLYCAPEEQKKIANYLDEKCKAINELISCKQEVVGKLQQYKKSLIYEVVTGKKEV